MSEEIVMWGIHNTNNESMLLRNKVLALGWAKMGDLSKIKQDRDSYYKLYNEVYPNNSKQSIANSAGQLFRFVNEAKIGDYVIYPTKFNRMINIGIIESDYYFDEKENEYNQQRKVKWIKEFPRIDFSQGALYEIGSFTTFFRVKHYADEFLNVLNNKKQLNIQDDEEDSMATSETIIENTKDYVLKELNKKYKGYDLENVVADLLNAMGYRTKLSKHGGDSGRDIIAYKDELPPRIVVQVKSQNGDINESTIQSLKGAMDEGDYGLFVTLSDYTQNARKYLEKHSIIKSLNGSEFVDLILKYYNGMSDEFKNSIKLKMVYIPIIENEENEVK